MKPYAKPGFLPVLRAAAPEEALIAAEALLQEQVNVLEVLLDTRCGPEMLQQLRSAYPQMILGAGNVATAQQCQAVCRIPVQFAAMPFFDAGLVEMCLQSGVEALPTCFTPSEIAAAKALGLDTVCLPLPHGAEALDILREYRRIFPDMKFLPAAGVRREALPELIASPAVCTVAADWIFPQGAITAEKAEAIRCACREARKSVLGFELAHVGINCEDTEECLRVAGVFRDIFGFPNRDNGNSVYASDAIEVMKFMQIGSLGHLAIRSNSVERAAEELAGRGMTAIESTAKYKDGRLNVVYYREEIGHFGIHLIQRIV